MPYWLDLEILHYVAVNKNIFINQRFNFKLKNILNNKLTFHQFKISLRACAWPILRKISNSLACPKCCRLEILETRSSLEES